MSEEPVGTITHYFAPPQVGVVRLTAGVKVGDTVACRGHGADLQQTIVSMQMDRAPVDTAAPRSEVAIQVDQRVREGTQVYRVTP